MPQVTVRFYAGAARAAGTDQRVMSAGSVGELEQQLSENPELAKVCAVAVFLVDGTPADSDTALTGGAEVHVLPPFAGG